MAMTSPIEKAYADSAAVQRARAVHQTGDIDPGDALLLVKQLKKEDAFRWGRVVLNRLLKKGVSGQYRRQFLQELALCTYKDPDRPALLALTAALKILDQADDLEETEDQETLGLAGAIHKRIWQVTAQRRHLEAAYAYYLRGHKGNWLDNKPGYTSINAAFVLDLLASLEEREARSGTGSQAISKGAIPAGAIERRRQAHDIRTILVEQLPKLLNHPARNDALADDWWFLVTIAEAFFGLGDYRKAGEWLQRAKKLGNIADWEFRSTAFQLATLYQIQHPASTATPGSDVEATRMLDAFVGSETACTSAFVGKVGLALSGGGFRASLFHIGVLARLADLDVLRHVEVLSCVSGGSIIGAYYYLHLRNLLQDAATETANPDQMRQAYVDLVTRVATDFLAGVQTNLRMRVFGNPLVPVRALLEPGYSHTVELGRLLESTFYRPVFHAKQAVDRPDSIPMRELKIIPQDCNDRFAPKKDNWRRKAKVPVLVLNATTLNTAHNWQYTATFMGESPFATNPTVDGTNRLRRMYYGEAPDLYQDTTLGQAVVASACVPGLFEPVRLDRLYEREEIGVPKAPFVLRQVDGGVHDNQGIASLFEQDCSVILVSDASGQINTTIDPGGGIVSPLTRSNSVLMQRVRQEQFARLKTAFDGGLLKGMMFVHLKQDLDVQPVGWRGCEEPIENADVDAATQLFTGYGVRKEIQNLLAGVRTDLDSFSEIEAFALMASGYRMAERYLRDVDVLPRQPPADTKWSFLAVEDVMTRTKTTDASYLRLRLLLQTASIRLFKAFHQSRGMKLAGIAAGIAVLVLCGLLWWMLVPPTMRLAIGRWQLLAAIGVTAMALTALAVPRVRDYLRRVAWVFIGILICLPVWFHIWFVDRAFLRMGKLRRIKPADAPTS